MAEVLELVYIVVVDGEEKKEREGIASFGYTRPVLQSTLQLMGCKARHAFKISRRVFNVLQSESSLDTWPPPKIEVSRLDTSQSDYDKGNSSSKCKCFVEVEVGDKSVLQKDDIYNAEPYDLCKRCTTVVNRETFLDIICDILAEYKYVGPTQRDDLVFACRIRERKESVTVLLCGTSGCGKSTLSSLLGSRLGITTVISTDSIRHMMRSFADEKQNPLLWASTYHAGECLDPIAVSEAMARRKAKKLTHIFHSVPMDDVSDVTGAGKACTHMLNVNLSNNELISARQMAIEGFKAQSEMVIDNLDRLITAWEKRKESVVVEGVHLSLNFVMELMKRHPSIIPFMIYIANESKHLERFAVRAKYMALDPTKNKYVRYFHNIRTIQEYLCNWADKHLVPKINNTNVDRSVAAIHATVFSCLRRREMGEHFYDPITNTVPLIDEEHRNQVAANSLSSKGMFQLIQRRGSSRNLMALINTDGSVAKAWPVNTGCCNRRSIMCQGNAKGVINPMYGPLKISKAEPVNLQFGHFGISAWPSVIGASSHATTVDESFTDGTESESRNFSSCCSSPRISDGPAKEVREEFVASGSDEEAEILPTVHSDGDLSDVEGKYIHEEIEGSVEEESTKSDEEYDLVTEKLLENGYWSDDDKSRMCRSLLVDSQQSISKKL